MVPDLPKYLFLACFLTFSEFHETRTNLRCPKQAFFLKVTPGHLVQVFRKCTEQSCSSLYTMNIEATRAYLYIPSLESVCKMSWKTCLEVIEPTLDDNKFPQWHTTIVRIVTLQQIFDKSLEYTKNTVLSTWKKQTKGYVMKNLVCVAGVQCCRSPATGRQITVSLLRNLCPCRGRKPQPLTVGAGLRQRCLLSQLDFVVCISVSQWFSEHGPLQFFDRWTCTPKSFYERRLNKTITVH